MGPLAGVPPGFKEVSSHARGLGTDVVIALVLLAGVLVIAAMYFYFSRLDPDEGGEGLGGEDGGPGGPNGNAPPDSRPPGIRVPEPGPGEIRVFAARSREREPVG